MKKFFKSKISIIILLLSFPIIFIPILKFFIWILPGEMIGSIDGWLGFLGGYFGVLGAIGTVWWQLKKEEHSEIKGLIFYITDILEYNCCNYTEEYIKKINNEACSMLWLPNYQEAEINLKSFNLSKEEKLLLYKHNYKNLIKLNEKIENILECYKLSNDEESIFKNLFSLIKNSENLKNPLITKICKEIDKLSMILFEFSDYFYYYPEKEISKNDINIKINNLDKNFIRTEIFKIKYSSKESLEHYKKLETFFNEFQSFEYSDISYKYMLGLHILLIYSRTLDLDLGKKLFNVIIKKIVFFDTRFIDLNKEMTKILSTLKKGEE